MGTRLLIGGAVLLCGASCAESSSARSQPPNSSLEQTLRRVRAEHGVPALAAAVVRGDSIQSAAVGVRRVGASGIVRLDDRFHIASCTKSMTATLAAILVEEGRLRWTSRLVEVIPELQRTARPEYRGTTLEQLLVHYGAGSGGTFFVRIFIVPDLDAAIVVASNSGDAGAATRDVVDAVLNELGGTK